ncbi:MAG TPA: PEP-CTERM sorting domain-containing protein [Planctomycetota bacterium]|nr:PEP-CTERM sorting domain-containing protein [Planctomycetota bacterium]HRR81096.1 PEP-CTERM sorting domain-containing protein [Planctomycetota bacterium]HRT93472.1 PEP-CTERM sorting domain-containing protein [Planctomycetota bacterium]
MRRLLIGLWLSVLSGAVWAVPITISITPTADAFVRSEAPASNYGLAGGLSVSGSAAVNASGQQRGLLNTFMRFDLSAFVAAMDAAFGAGGWQLEDAVLDLTEQGTPNNPIFNRGIGQFEVRWLANDAWAEGTGTPNAPTADGVTYSSGLLLLQPALDMSLGLFTNLGVDGPLSLTLSLPEAFVDDILAAGPVSLFLTAASDTVGFTFNARDIPLPRLPPVLRLTADAAPAAIPEPASVAIFSLGLAAAGLRRRRN